MNFAPPSCPNCGADTLTSVYSAAAFDGPGACFALARCAGCALVSTLEVTEPVLQRAYAEDYYGAGSTKFTGVIEGIVRYLARRRAAALIARWRARGGSGLPRVLDVGCGRGTLLSAFRALGARVLGLERDAFPAPAELEGMIESGSLADGRFDTERFDVIVIWHVLEHVPQVDALIMQAVSHLNPGGLLVIAVPNFGSFQQHTFGPHWFHLDLPRHVAHIESGWLQERLRHAGLKLESVSHLDPLQNIYGFIQSTLNALRPAQPNELYQLLKAGTSAQPLRLLGWLLAAALIAPAAVLETVLAALGARGATVSVIARQA